MAAELADPSRYGRQLERLAARHAKSGRLDDLSRRGVSLRRLVDDRVAAARRISREMRARRYVPSPVVPREVVVDKPRTIYALDALDLVVHGVVAEIINERVAPRLSDDVYSYRPGRSSWDATAAFGRFIRAHVAARPVHDRGLHVFRADIANYGPSIPNDDGAPLWRRLAAVLGPFDGEADIWAFELLRRVIRPMVAHEDGTQRPLERGMPTGSPAGTAAQNWFLDPLDAHLAADAEGFYARYGDDLLFAHPDLHEVQRRRERAETWLRGEGLELKQAKLQLSHFTGAGRPSPMDPALEGTTRIEYLGVRIDFKGTIGLTTKKRRAAMSDLRARLRRTSRLMRQRSLRDRAQALIDVTNEFLLATDAVAGPYVDWCLTRVTDRSQLDQLDYEVARAIIAELVGHRGVRGFREVSWKELRAWGLVSLVHARNKGRRAVLPGPAGDTGSR